MKKIAVLILTALFEATVKKIAVLLVAVFLTGCGAEKTTIKDLPKVTLMGAPSGGGSGRPKRVELTHSGIAVYLSSMVSFRANGQLYDGRGILPDLEVPITATDLIGTTDSVLDQAIKRLQYPEPSNAS